MKQQSMIMTALSLLLFTGTAFAAPVDLSIGGTAWYAWWKPAWADAKATTRAYNSGVALFLEDSHDFKTSSSAMAGPILSIGFLERWSIQTVFTMGRLLYKSNGISRDALITGASGMAPSLKKYTRDVLKWDSDTSIGCSVHRMVKIFAGFKHQGYRYEERMSNVLMAPGDTSVFTRALTDDVRSYGGGLGIGLTFPLGADFYLMASLSGLALWSFETVSIKLSKTLIYSSTMVAPVILFILPPKGHYFSYGGSASLSLAYNIEKINTTISLGGRYQLLYNRQHYSKHNLLYNDVAINIIDRQYDHFFGITLSAIYTFHMGKKS